MPTVVAGLESGTVTLDTKLNDSGTLRLDNGRTKIDDADRKPMGILKLADAIAFSRNVVASRVALGLAPTLQKASAMLHEVWTRLGFGSPSGVDLSGEVGGLVHDPAKTKWREIDIANGSFGQGVAVTPLQLATAYAAMMNGGILVTPHFVGAIDGTPVVVKDRGRVLDPSLSPKLIDLMNHVVTTVPFYRDRTLIPGYYVGGKTGTAQIWDSNVHNWKGGVFNFSFIGYIGRQVGRPDVLVAVKINEGHPSVRRVGQLAMPVMSFELFRRIATDAMSVPGLLPELPIDRAAAGRLGD
jgi:cell division protein FtsI/penicillin-binding protein 2